MPQQIQILPLHKAKTYCLVGDSPNNKIQQICLNNSSKSVLIHFHSISHPKTMLHNKQASPLSKKSQNFHLILCSWLAFSQILSRHIISSSKWWDRVKIKWEDNMVDNLILQCPSSSNKWTHLITSNKCNKTLGNKTKT